MYSERNVRAALLAVLCDLPASKKVVDFLVIQLILAVLVVTALSLKVVLSVIIPFLIIMNGK